jgi:hypothetical protein
MSYEDDWNGYVENVNLLWAEVQKAPVEGLSPEQLQQLKTFQAENNTFKQTIDDTHLDMLLAYSAADAEGRSTMEQQLRQLQKALLYTEQVFRNSLRREQTQPT